jgi:peroxiredoxin
MKYEGTKAPNVTFKTRVRDESVGGPNPYRWEDVTSKEIFKDKRVLVFALPGAFTPTCSEHQLPGFEKGYKQFKQHGIDEVYCLSVNDAFVMFNWGKSQKLKNVKLLPDGSGLFTKKMGMLVKKDNLGFGERSWRYAMIVNNGVIEKMFIEKGKKNNIDSDPYGVSSPENVFNYVSGGATLDANKKEHQTVKVSRTEYVPFGSEGTV